MCGKMKREHDRAACVTNYPKSSTRRVCHLPSEQSGPGSAYSAIEAWWARVMNQWLTRKAPIPDTNGLSGMPDILTLVLSR